MIDKKRIELKYCKDIDDFFKEKLENKGRKFYTYIIHKKK